MMLPPRDGSHSVGVTARSRQRTNRKSRVSPAFLTDGARAGGVAEVHHINKQTEARAWGCVCVRGGVVLLQSIINYF